MSKKEEKIINLQSLQSNKEKHIPMSLYSEKELHEGLEDFIVKNYPKNCYKPSDYFNKAGIFLYKDHKEKKRPTLEKRKNKDFIGTGCSKKVWNKANHDEIYISIAECADKNRIHYASLSARLRENTDMEFEFVPKILKKNNI